MPKVGKKHFPYTPEGKAQADIERRKKAAMDSQAQQGITAAMRGRKTFVKRGTPVRGGSPQLGQTTQSTSWESDR